MAKSWVVKCKIAVRSMLAVLRNIKHLSKGQALSDHILQLAHRLEKGLTISSPRRLWGWDKAHELLSLLETADHEADKFAIETGLGVLYAYVVAKQQSGDEEEISRADALQRSMAGKGIWKSSAAGGIIKLTKKDLQLSEEELLGVEKLFYTRHSVRDYSDEIVSDEVILKSVQLANRCPSACNRQPFQVYVIDAEERSKHGIRNEFNANKYILITGRISAFCMTEVNDWLVSASVFAGYLSLALHAHGLESCIMRKNLINEHGYNETMREYCHIPDDEQIVLEFAVGYAKERFSVPVSNRKNATNIVKFIKS